MKKQLLIIACLCSSFHQAFSQIPNSSFDTWNNSSYYLSPVGYITSDDVNYIQDGLPPQETHPLGVTQYTPSHSGAYAVKMQNVVGKTNPGNVVVDTFPAGLISSENPTNPFSGFGFPCTVVPASLTGYYQFFQGATGINLDTALIGIFFTKWNTTSKQADTIGVGEFTTYATQNSYKQFSAPITFIPSTVPDTAIILIASSGNNIIASPNTYLIIDDLAFTGISTGTKTPNYLNGLPPSLYPNPASSNVTISNLVIDSYSVQISDLAGKKIKTISVNGDAVNFNTDGLQQGMYIYSILDESNAILYTNRFIVN